MNSEILSISLTIVATIISVYNTILFLRQPRLVEKQTLLQRGQVYPLIKIEDKIVDENTVKLDLKNMAEERGDSEFMCDRYSGDERVR